MLKPKILRGGDEPIDAVYTWVDGTSPKFQEQLRRYRRELYEKSHSSAGTRFYDKSRIAVFAPVIRTLRSVDPQGVHRYQRSGSRLNGSKPPALSLIRHQDLFPDPSVLAGIQLDLDRMAVIPYPRPSQAVSILQRRFLPRPARAAGILSHAQRRPPHLRGTFKIHSSRAVQHASDAGLAFTEALLNARFGVRAGRRKSAHTPRLLDRTIIEELNRIWAIEIQRTAGHRFRHPEDVSLETLYSYLPAGVPGGIRASRASRSRQIS